MYTVRIPCINAYVCIFEFVRKKVYLSSSFDTLISVISLWEFDEVVIILDSVLKIGLSRNVLNVDVHFED